LSSKKGGVSEDGESSLPIPVDVLGSDVSGLGGSTVRVVGGLAEIVLSGGRGRRGVEAGLGEIRVTVEGAEAEAEFGGRGSAARMF
jgi:hypothetical protein